MKKSKLINALKVTGALGLVGISGSIFGGCGIQQPRMANPSDLNGDGTPDILIRSEDDFGQEFEWIFFSQEDGSYLKTQRYAGSKETMYFKAEDGTTYFFDQKTQVYRIAN